MGNGIRVGGATFTDSWGQRKRTADPQQPQKRKRYMKAYLKEYARTHREDIRRNYRRCMPPLSELIPGYVPLNAMKPGPPPPCGGDCECGCPVDEGCLYPDWEETHADRYLAPNGTSYSRARHREVNRRCRENLRERRRSDSELDAHIREGQRASSAKHRAKVKWCKAGGDPARFERQWAALGGSIEAWKEFLKGGGQNGRGENSGADGRPHGRKVG